MRANTIVSLVVALGVAALTTHTAASPHGPTLTQKQLLGALCGSCNKVINNGITCGVGCQGGSCPAENPGVQRCVNKDCYPILRGQSTVNQCRTRTADDLGSGTASGQ
ncbi:hypothetical protein M427DRAFT_44408 [Gonapodya prolifera JEL478]|uniref:Uncharacterized protein n=1 Tax=Gonapodya prolifera (strain JEL478) TaxID=1344416 RepID=A0A139AFJ7_GONPJ|nr:hypothetical protein M427DRAFT_44408 [Gonapodya prolifera JEL478]|eukprot:KXS15567.1 hypothetical protein M427DRAFT_44408 [Gonapodya prolifera JEL478]